MAFHTPPKPKNRSKKPGARHRAVKDGVVLGYHSERAPVERLAAACGAEVVDMKEKKGGKA